MNINDLSTAANDGIALMAVLQKMVASNATTQNLSASVTNAVALAKTIQASMTNFMRLKAATDQVWSKDEIKELMHALGDALTEGLEVFFSRTDWTEQQRLDARNQAIDLISDRFASSVQVVEDHVSQNRANGITAIDRKLLGNEEHE